MASDDLYGARDKDKVALGVHQCPHLLLPGGGGRGGRMEGEVRGLGLGLLGRAEGRRVGARGSNRREDELGEDRGRQGVVVAWGHAVVVVVVELWLHGRHATRHIVAAH